MKRLIEEYADPSIIDSLPNIEAFFDGREYWLVDGFHRLAAYKKVKRRKIKCDIRNGTFEEAKKYVLSRNAEHGQRRTASDIYNAIIMCLDFREAWLNDSRTRLNKDWIISTCKLTESQYSKHSAPIRNRLKSELRDIILKMRANGSSLAEIAKETGYGRTQVKSIIDSAEEEKEATNNALIDSPGVEKAKKSVRQLYNRTAFLDQLTSYEIKQGLQELSEEQTSRLIRLAEILLNKA